MSKEPIKTHQRRPNPTQEPAQHTKGSVLAPVMFIVNRMDLSEGIQNYMNMFSDDAKILGKIGDTVDSESTVPGVIEAVLSAASRPSYSVIFITDLTISTITDHLRIPGGVGSFVKGFDSNATTETFFSVMFPDIKRLRQRSSYPTVVVISDDLAFLATFVKWSLKGRLLVWSTRLLVVTRLPLHHLHHHYTAFSKMNAMLLIIHDDDDIASIRCNVYVQLPFSPRGTQPLWVASWTPQRGLALTSSLPLFPDKFSRFIHGPTLVAASEGNPFYTMQVTNDPKVPGRQTVRFAGPMAELMDYLAAALNFSYTQVRPGDGVWGARRWDGTWSGMMGMVMREEASIGVGPFILSEDRAEVVDFTVPIFIDYWRILGARGRAEVDPWGFLYPLEPLVWAAILGALLVLPLTTFLMSSWSSPGGHSTWLLVTFDCLRVLLQQDTKYHVEWWWERVVLAVWGLVTVVLTQSYAGNLMALLAVRHIPQPYQSRRHVLDDPSITMIWLKGSAVGSYLHSVNSGIYREMAEAEKAGRLIWRTQEQFAGDINTLVRRGDHVLIEVENGLKTFIAQDFSRTAKCSFYSSREGFMPLIFGMICPKDSPIVPAINKRIISMAEAGLFFQWLKSSAANFTVCSHAPSKFTVNTVLTMSNVWGIFIILIAGYGLSLLALCIEFLSTNMLLDRK
ncbi:probable glutamate receptor [Procambarus clarkii]|uniref:probable glutamate receptor n=1 Tax=Procambarus clarkii TaxID=6728 RepID=UPI003743DE4C